MRSPSRAPTVEPDELRRRALRPDPALGQRALVDPVDVPCAGDLSDPAFRRSRPRRAGRRSAPGSFCARMSARAPSGPSSRHHVSAIQSGYECFERRLGRRRLGQRRRGAARIPSGEPAQHGVRERHRPLEAGTSHELDRLVHRRVARDPVDERRAGTRRGGAPPGRERRVARRVVAPSVSIAWSSVRDALDGAEREPLRERAIAFVEPGDRRRGSARSAYASSSKTRSRTSNAAARAGLTVADREAMPRTPCAALRRAAPRPARTIRPRPTRARQTVTPRPWSSARAPMCGESART